MVELTSVVENAICVSKGSVKIADSIVSKAHPARCRSVAIVELKGNDYASAVCGN